mgnify:CR=1 FL=1
MALNYLKLEEADIRLDNIAKEEAFGKLPEQIINFLNNDVLNYILHTLKYPKNDIVSARVLNNWIKENVVVIEENDRGRIKRFNKLQCIWLNIVEEARKYGMYLEDLKRIHRELLTSDIKNLTYLKIGVINEILNESQILELSPSSNCAIISESNYNKKKKLSPHVVSRLIFSLSTLVQREFPKANFDLPITIENYIADEDKLLLLFLLKTYSYEYMKVYLSSNDIRLIENPTLIVNNKDLHQAISSWSFLKIEIYLERGATTVINGIL